MTPSYYYGYLCNQASSSCPQSIFPYQSSQSLYNLNTSCVCPSYAYYNYASNCGHRCCYEESLRDKQRQFEQTFCSAQIQKALQDKLELEKKEEKPKKQEIQKNPPLPTTDIPPSAKIKIDKATDTSTDMNRNSEQASPTSSASPPPAPPPLDIRVRATYCARCRYNIEHSRHDLSSSQSHLLNGGVPTNNYGIPRSSYSGEDDYIFYYIKFFTIL